MSKYVLPFSAAEATLAHAGGKGTSLAGLAHADLPVPPGFIVATDAYRAFVEANPMEPNILALAQRASPDEPDGLDRISADIRLLFERAPIPADIAAEIGMASYDLAARIPTSPLPVAIRSSATPRICRVWPSRVSKIPI